MLSVTVYGGANEIGGNKILVECEDTRVMLDFGRRMGFDSDFFSEFINPRTNTELRDRLIIGALPNIPGIYRSDMLKPHGLGTDSEYDKVLTADSPMLDHDNLETYEDYDARKGFVDAILVSHAHLDHVGDLNFVHPDIPVCCTPVTESLIRAIDDVTTFKSCALELSRHKIGFTKRGMFPGAPKISKKEHDFRDCINQSHSIGDIQIKMIAVDHSVPGACSFLLTTNDDTILYTGDLRFHGRSSITKDVYLNNIDEDVDVMICEGTRVNSDSVITEDMVLEGIKKDIARTEGLVFVDFSWKDTTRYETIRQAALDNGRTFVIDARLAYLLDTLDMYPDDGSVKVFLRRNGTALYSPNDYTRSKHELGFSVDKDNLDLTHYENGLTAAEIMEEPHRYVLMLSFFQFNQIFDFADKDGKIPGSFFIKAQCEPFCDDMELDEERMINWLDKFGIDFQESEPDIDPDRNHHGFQKIKRYISRSHVSGHASRPELKELISRLKPKVLIPVHTLDPDEFKNIAKEIMDETGHKIDVIIPKQGERYDL